MAQSKGMVFPPKQMDPKFIVILSQNQTKFEDIWGNQVVVNHICREPIDSAKHSIHQVLYRWLNSRSVPSTVDIHTYTECIMYIYIYTYNIHIHMYTCIYIYIDMEL